MNKSRCLRAIAVVMLVLLLLSAGETPASASFRQDVPASYQLYVPLVQYGNPFTLEVNIIDVGQGDSILLTTSDGKAALIDGGERNSGALQFLQSKQITHLDLVIATHPHSDHIGGLIAILQTLAVDEVVTNGQSLTTTTYDNFLAAIESSGTPYVEAGRGDVIPFGVLTFQVFNPVATTGDTNTNSMVLLLPFEQVTFLFMGDATTASETSITAAGLPVNADILKVGHHGSDTSSSPAFLALVSPAIAVYSAGVDNIYGFPDPSVIANLLNAGALVYGTDVNGTVTVTTDGVTYTLRTVK